MTDLKLKKLEKQIEKLQTHQLIVQNLAKLTKWIARPANAVVLSMIVLVAAVGFLSIVSQQSSKVLNNKSIEGITVRAIQCSNDADCPVSQVCSPSTFTCIAGPTCSNGANNPPTCNQCPVGSTFNGTSCVTNSTSCSNNADCPANKICDPGTHVCVIGCAVNTGIQCGTDNCGTNHGNCTTGLTCSNGTCISGSTCSNGANNPPTCNQCPIGSTFNGTSCIAGTQCTNDADCIASQLCDPNSRVCVARGTQCTNDADCTASQQCDPNSRVCVARTCTVTTGIQCGTDNCGISHGSCAGTNVCSSGNCVAGATCTNGATNPSACNICNAGFTLVNGNCVANCTNGATNPPSCNNQPTCGNRGSAPVNGQCCTSGDTNQGGICQAPPSATCSGTYPPSAGAYPNCTCNNGANNPFGGCNQCSGTQQLIGGTCQNPPDTTPPSASALSYTVTAGQSVRVDRLIATDASGINLNSFVVGLIPANAVGTLTVFPDGAVNYTPPATVANATIFTVSYQVKDNSPNQNIGSSSITITVNPIPVTCDYNLIGGQCLPYLCPSAEVGTPGATALTGTGIAGTGTYSGCNLCASGYTANSFQDTCTQNACPSGQERINGTCVAVCGTYSTRNAAGNCICNAGYESYNASCVTVCAANQIRNASGVCVLNSCPAGQELVGGACVATCGANSTRSPAGTCVCNSNFELYAGSCVPVCGANQIRSNSGVCIAQTPACSGTGKVLDANNNCVCDGANSYYVTNTSLTPANQSCTRCAAPSNWVAGTNANGTCMTPASSSSSAAPICSTDPTVDTDGDGIKDVIEAAGPNNGDGNGDGIKDCLQKNVASSCARGDKCSTIVVTGSCNSFGKTSIIKESDLPIQDPVYDYPFGLYAFEVTCTGTAQLVTYWYGVPNTPSQITRKYGPTTPGDDSTAKFFDFPSDSRELIVVGGQSVLKITQTLRDGGFGDATGIDGIIKDPTGLAVLAATSSTAPATTIVKTGVASAVNALFAISSLSVIALGVYAVFITRSRQMATQSIRSKKE